MFVKALRPLLADDADALARLEAIREGFAGAMQEAIEAMWAAKLGLPAYDEALMRELLQLMVNSRLDATIFFRRLSDLPEDVSALKESFYLPSSEELDGQWNQWLQRWRAQLSANGDLRQAAAAMQRVNPAITWREWLIAPAYEQAAQGDTRRIQELQTLFSTPYEAPSPELAATYDRLRPRDYFNAGGVSHYSCSS